MGFFSRRNGPARASYPQATAVTPTTNAQFQSPPPAYSQPLPQYPPSPYHQQQDPSSAVYSDNAVFEGNILETERLGDQDAIIDQFSVIMAGIDEEQHNVTEEDYTVMIAEPKDASSHTPTNTRALVPHVRSRDRRVLQCSNPQKVTIWTKVSSYTNSRLPADIPPLRVYIPTWPLICLAAQYSANVYQSPQSSEEQEAFVSADAGLGTKAMVIKSVPCDDQKVLVFAIRGTNMYSLKDWNINMNTAPVSPAGFLDDEGNLCHSGFLRVAKAMTRPIAMRLRTLLEENPGRASCSLVITGHSAGGAVAALLYTHMLSSIESELSILTGCFKRVHCVVFGAPPVSLLPLNKPADRKYKKSLFFSFINEGDPIVRAERAYLRSLANLLYSPLPSIRAVPRNAAKKSTLDNLHQSVSNADLSLSKLNLTSSQTRPPPNPQNSKKHPRWNLSHSALPTLKPNPYSSLNASSSNSAPYWPLPTATLSNSGRLVLLRVPHQEVQKRKGQQIQRTTSVRWERHNLASVSAHTVTDEQLRVVIFGDPSMHSMQVYLRRVEMLALKAVTARQ